MMAALARLAPCRMSVAEFLDWPGDGSGRKFELIDGDPQAMAPASITHGTIQATLARLLGNHLAGTGCRVVIEPGVVPRIRSEANMRVPDLAVTCDSDEPGMLAMADPVVLVEVLSPSNEAETRANVWTYTTIPTVREIVLVRSTSLAAELLRREPDGSWPANPQAIGTDGVLSLASLDFSCPLAALYAGTYLTR
jgi:Uma2 family endonuclease